EAVKRTFPSLAGRYSKAMRALIRRWRALAEDIEDKIDTMAADESLAEQAGRPGTPIEVVMAELGL
ncbi:MAG: hypothetical protein ABI193_21640, partial [Minicystis sp.]